MSERRSLTEGLKATPAPINAELENAFVYGAKAAASPTPAPPVTPPPVQSSVTSRVPISTRMRSDFATALKRASLERQLNCVEPNTLQDILEAAIEPWLRSNGYLS